MKPKMFGLFLVVIVIPMANGAIPGMFFWKPRLGIDFRAPSQQGTEFNSSHLLNQKNIEDGFVVLIKPYEIVVTVAALADGIKTRKPHPQLDPLTAIYYTNSYRWFLRHCSLIEDWLSGRINYFDTHKVWRKRFRYMEEFTPYWLKTLLPFVDAAEWAEEEKEMKLYDTVKRPFVPHLRYPSKTFTEFASQG